MPTPCHPAAAYRPSGAELLHDAALHCLGHAAGDVDDAATRLRWLAGAARVEHGLPADAWLSPEQCARLLRMATLADVLAAEARAALGEVAG